MTEQTPMPPDDQELEQFLARRSDLSRLHHASTEGEGAPSALDARVLQLAAEELRRPVQPARRPQRWGRPLALAASLVLVVSLALVVQQRPLPPVAVPVSQPALPAPQEAPLAAAPAATAQPFEAAAAKAEELRTKKIAPALATAPSRRAQAAPKPLPPPATFEDAIVQKQARSAIVSDQAAPAAPLDSAPQQVRPAALPPPMPVAPAAGAVPAPAPSAVMAAAPPAAPFERVQSPPIMAAPAPAPAPAPAIRQPGRSEPCASQPDSGNSNTPQAGQGDDVAWLDRIRRLRDTPDLAAARAELACFSRGHAPQQVPDDLKPLLQPSR